MGNVYPYDLPEIDREPIPNSVLIDVAKIIRSFSEFEFTINLHLCQLTGLSPKKLDILLGKASLSRKISMAREIAATHSHTQFKTMQDEFFATGFRAVLDHRNTLAHSLYLGTQKTDQATIYCFLTDDTDKDANGTTGRIVKGIGAKAIHEAALFCEENFPRFEEAMGLSPLRETLHSADILRHHKSRRSRDKGKKP